MAVVTAAVGAGLVIAGGAIKSGKEHKAMRRARGEKGRAAAKVESLQNSRQTITNPYGGVESLASLASDLSGQMSNPYSSLGVATQAAEIQMEQSDIALANSLDAMMATGACAGGATALAQAALRSKKGVAAGIEQQEAITGYMKKVLITSKATDNCILPYLHTRDAGPLHPCR